ncbi:MAG: alpha-glycosidase [Treponema sp. CETP13]|nr:MAG: alpha-glycosidase [Treponema sp. CETP13]
MNFSAIEHIPYDNYCYPLNTSDLVINIKTGKDISKVFLIEGDPFTGGIMGGNWKWTGTRTQIVEKTELQRHFWWSIIIKPEFKRVKYYFEIHGNKDTSSNNENVYYYLEGGFYSKDEFNAIKGMQPFFFFPWMNPADINTTPDWPNETVWYQIFPERFCNGNPKINSSKVIPWAKPDQKVENNQDFGGDLQGIINKLDYLKDLGIGGLYLNPINYARSKHKYDTIDYLKIDPFFGDESKMKELCDEAHKRNIKIMLDGVFNHSGWEFFAWQDVLKNGEKSKYAHWFMVNDYSFTKEITKKNEDGMLIPSRFPSIKRKGYAQKNKYYAFAFADFMPKLNTNNPEVIKYLLYVCETWVKQYDIDALRLDVANEISHKFCKELQTKMRELKSDFYIVGEIWHNSLPWLRGDEFDSVMNYPLTQGIKSFWEQNELSVVDLEYSINRCYTMYMKQTNKVLFNLMDSHDTARLVTECGSREKALQQFAFMFGMNGSACIYYGTECLLEGGHDPDCRRCMPWNELEAGKYDEIIAFFKKIIELRLTYSAMRNGKLQFVKHKGFPRLVHIRKIAKTSDSIEIKRDTGEILDLYFNCGDSPFEVNLGSSQIVLQRGYNFPNLKINGLIIAKE